MSGPESPAPAGAPGPGQRGGAAIDDALARLRRELDLPPELSAAVAETVAWAYSLDARAR